MIKESAFAPAVLIPLVVACSLPAAVRHEMGV
jgi:hypothetical protein